MKNANLFFISSGLFLLSLNPTNVMAQTGVALLEQCEQSLAIKSGDATNLFGAGYCLGTVKGMALVLAATAEYSKGDQGQKIPICIPLSAAQSPEQNIRIVIKYLKDHPETLHLQDTSLIINALGKAFPCDSD